MTLRKILATCFFVASFVLMGTQTVSALQEYNTDRKAVEVDQGVATVHFFGHEGCKFCLLKKDFIVETEKERSDIVFIYYDIVKDAQARDIFNRVMEVNKLPRIVPTMLVGGSIVQGFDSSETTGARVVRIATENIHKKHTIEYYLTPPEERGGDVINGKTEQEKFIFNLPIVGVVDLGDFSLFTLSAGLGFVDGFNPCAMWVLITFLLVLLQIGNRSRMWKVAGLFIIAQAIMYYLILNVWYKTWDFIGLDAIVTPIVGIVAMMGGVYFISRYFKNKGRLVCDVTSSKHQKGIEGKIKKLVHAPFTIVTIVGIIGVALSVNIIEFACSVGIPQAFTKIIELNQLSFIESQFYLWTYIVFYMIDDFVVFGIAVYKFDKLHSSYKYAQYSALIGGILMIIIGAVLLFAPNVLVW